MLLFRTLDFRKQIHNFCFNRLSCAFPPRNFPASSSGSQNLPISHLAIVLRSTILDATVVAKFRALQCMLLLLPDSLRITAAH